MNKVFIGVGHGGKDPGAVSGSFKESEINLVMSLALRDELTRHGVEVAISRIKEENDPLSEEIAESNIFKPDVAIECHNNAGGGDGFEVYRQTNRYSAGSLKLAQCLETRVKFIGQNSRGIKTKLNAQGGDYFGWLRQNNCPAVLCEGFFVDNTTDRKLADTAAKQKRFGVAYAHGVLNYLGIAIRSGGSTITPEPPSQPAKPATSTIYAVQVGAWNNKLSADQYAAKLEKLMIDGKAVQTLVLKK